MWLTACCADLALPEGPDGLATLRYANAAQLPLLHVHGAEAREIYEAGTFLGMVGGAAFPERELQLAPRDRIFVFTDGLVEQWSERGDKLDEAALLEVLRGAGPLAGVVQEAGALLGRFRGDCPQQDDVTLIGIEYRGRA
jgi:sigma-B regulation protein RsbU (phosphoserine phosphatase)